MNLTSEEWTARDWAGWVAQQVEKRVMIFCAEPDELFSAYSREVNYTRDYHGRELLELLQNADDAGVGRTGDNKVNIVLMEEGLCVANTGKPFLESGIKSLMISDNSPKKNKRASYIGNKGLGFRSILGWTRCPFILSGNLALGFDGQRAQAWLESLCDRNTGLREAVNRHRENQYLQQVIPTLAIPAVLDASGKAVGDVSALEGFPAIWARARLLRKEGYDTVIAIPFTNADAYREAKEQLDDIGRELLLFTKHLASLEISWPGGSRKWRVNHADDIVEIRADDEEPQIWEIFASTGEIPENLLSSDLKQTPGYEIKIAVPADSIATKPFLFNYFQTQVRFPYPVIAHVTFEMTNNRQNIPDTAANKYLARKLGELMATVAEASYASSDPWRPLSFISATGGIDPVLEKLGFLQALHSAAQERKIIPVVRGQMVRPRDARQLGHDAEYRISNLFPELSTEKWLPAAYFGDVIKQTQDKSLRSMLDSLDIPVLGELEMRQRLAQASPTLDVSMRALMIAVLTQSGLMPRNPAPALLIDQNAHLIPADFQVFLPPEKTGLPPLPNWMNLRMLDASLNTALRPHFGNSARGLASSLSFYRLSEYSLQGLTQAAVAQANERIRTEQEQEKFYRGEVLQAIFDLYSAARAEGNVPHLQNVTVHLPTSGGRFAPANTLYFAQDYPSGRLTSALYGSINSDLLVAPLAVLPLEDADFEGVEGYFRWLGVADTPRVIYKAANIGESPHDRLPQAYLAFVKQSLKYPVKASHGEEFASPSDLLWAEFREVAGIDQLEQLIAYASPDALIAWIALDERLERWRRTGDVAAKVGVKPPKKQQVRL